MKDKIRIRKEIDKRYKKDNKKRKIKEKIKIWGVNKRGDILWYILATVLIRCPKVLRVIYIYYDDNEFLVDDLLVGIAIYKELMTPYGQHGVYYAVFSSLKTVRDYRDRRTVNKNSWTRLIVFFWICFCLLSARCCRRVKKWPGNLYFFCEGKKIFKWMFSAPTSILLCEKDILCQWNRWSMFHTLNILQ